MQQRDHPRGCGENGSFLSCLIISSGSPPRMRGKHGMAVEYLANPGITPAGAGKTPAPCLLHTFRWDHPRRCGENPCSHRQSLRHRGSPPQVRGKQSLTTAWRTMHGITPAGAGKTDRRITVGGLAMDHPRRCGENLMLTERLRCRLGSPPQVRGKLNIINYTLMSGRITPAGAGKTLLLPLKLSACRDHPRRCGENR